MAPPPPPPAQSALRRNWKIFALVGSLAALIFVLALGRVLPAFQVGPFGSPTVALAAPAAIDGLPKTDDYSSRPITVLGQHILNVASATYGQGDLRYAVVAISGAASSGNNAHVLLDTLSPHIAGDDAAAAGTTRHLSRSGVDYTCEQLAGPAPGATCSWDHDNVVGVVIQVGSTDEGRAADFADQARSAVRQP